MLYKYSNICAKKEMIKLRYLLFILLISYINECYSQNKYSLSAFGLNTSFLKRITYKNSFGIGINLGYDDKADTKFEVYGSTILSTTAPFEKRLNLTTFITYEYKMQDFSVLVDAGYYIYRIRSENSTPNFALPTT